MTERLMMLINFQVPGLVHQLHIMVQLHLEGHVHCLDLHNLPPHFLLLQGNLPLQDGLAQVYC